MTDHAASDERLDLAVVRALDDFGLSGTLTSLPAERDDLFLLHAPSNAKFIVRLSAPDEEAQAIVSQNQVLDSIAGLDETLPVPRVIASRAGDKTLWIEKRGVRRALRVFSFLEGIQVGKVECVPGQLQSVAHALARLDRALGGIAGQRGGSAGVWNVVKGPSLVPLLAHETDIDAREMAKSALERFETGVALRIGKLPQQLIHNDFNTKNVLVDERDLTKVVGIIDFGDLTYAPRVFDLAILLSKFSKTASPLSDAVEVVGAYARTLPLSEEEVGSIFQLLSARIAMRIAVWGNRERGQDYPDARRFVQDASALLRAVEEVGEEAFTGALQACAFGYADV